VAPDWLTALAWCYLAICFGCAGLIAYDIVFNCRPQPMGVMNFVFPITALYFGPAALALYWHWARSPHGPGMSEISPGRLAQPREGRRRAFDPAAMPDQRGRLLVSTEAPDGRDARRSPAEQHRPRWATMAIEVSHCGAGCTLGDVIAEFAVFLLAITIAGSTMAAQYLSDYVLALIFGIFFQYFAIAPMRGLGLRDGLIQAGKADFISLSAFEVGLFGWMAVMAYVLFPAPHNLMPNSAAYWLLMQVGMMIGFFASWPANVWLIKRGIKVAM
jgi:Domain of unknown function (DUF4396)